MLARTITITENPTANTLLLLPGYPFDHHYENPERTTQINNVDCRSYIFDNYKLSGLYGANLDYNPVWIAPNLYPTKTIYPTSVVDTGFRDVPLRAVSYLSEYTDISYEDSIDQSGATITSSFVDFNTNGYIESVRYFQGSTLTITIASSATVYIAPSAFSNVPSARSIIIRGHVDNSKDSPWGAKCTVIGGVA
jgi:hypothetical protein